MELEQDTQIRRLVPTLVQLCQRAAVAHLDSIYDLGNDLPYKLVKPVLERCTVEQLHRFEQLSPHLEPDTPEIWKGLCFRNHSMMANERYCIDDYPQEPDSWKNRYFSLQEAEARRFNELGSKLRTQRMKADERKKDKGIKYSDRVDFAKRPRTGWNTNAQPKSLFQKIKSDASRIQRSYNSRVLPPMPTSKSYRVLPQSSGASLPSVSSPSTANRVTVNTVIQHRPFSSSISSSNTQRSRLGASTPAHSPPPSADPPNKPLSTLAAQSTRTTIVESPHPPTKVPITPKKDPMASLFVPKRRIQSQRPA